MPTAIERNFGLRNFNVRRSNLFPNLWILSQVFYRFISFEEKTISSSFIFYMPSQKFVIYFIRLCVLTRLLRCIYQKQKKVVTLCWGLCAVLSILLRAAIAGLWIALPKTNFVVEYMSTLCAVLAAAVGFCEYWEFLIVAHRECPDFCWILQKLLIVCGLWDEHVARSISNERCPYLQYDPGLWRLKKKCGNALNKLAFSTALQTHF